MKKTVLNFTIIISGALLIFTAMSTSSCKKDQTCHGKVTVVDTVGRPVSGALVRLDAYSVNGQKMYPGITDAIGVVNFDIALPAIFDVTAQSTKYPGMVGHGSLNVDEPRKEGAVVVRIAP